MESTIPRNGMYFDPVEECSHTLVKTARLTCPVARRRVASSTRNDLARVTVSSCMNNGHSKKVFGLIGIISSALSELVVAISQATSQPIDHTQASEEKFASI